MHVRMNVLVCEGVCVCERESVVGVCMSVCVCVCCTCGSQE